MPLTPKEQKVLFEILLLFERNVEQKNTDLFTMFDFSREWKSQQVNELLLVAASRASASRSELLLATGLHIFPDELRRSAESTRKITNVTSCKMLLLMIK